MKLHQKIKRKIKNQKNNDMPTEYFEKQKGKKRGYDMPMKQYGQGKSPLEFGFLKKALGAVKGAVGGKGIAGALMNPIGALASKGGGLFMKEKNKKK